MNLNTREDVIDLVLDLRAARISEKKIKQLFNADPYTRVIYKEVKESFEIEEYLDNELTPRGITRFEKKLKEDPSLAAETNLHEKVNEAIIDMPLVEAIEKAYYEYTKKSKKEDSPIIVTKTKTIKLYHKRYFRWIAAASIVILLSFSISVYFSKSTPIKDKLYTQYYEPLGKVVTQHLVLKSSALTEAKDKYLQRKYYDALVIFNNLPNNLDIITEKDFYIGLSLMEMDSYKEAINKFNTVINDKEYSCKNQALWYLGLCYLKVNQKQKAIEVFKDIVENNSYNYDKAGKILKKIN